MRQGPAGRSAATATHYQLETQFYLTVYVCVAAPSCYMYFYGQQLTSVLPLQLLRLSVKVL